MSRLARSLRRIGEAVAAHGAVFSQPVYLHYGTISRAIHRRRNEIAGRGITVATYHDGRASRALANFLRRGSCVRIRVCEPPARPRRSQFVGVSGTVLMEKAYLYSAHPHRASSSPDVVSLSFLFPRSGPSSPSYKTLPRLPFSLPLRTLLAHFSPIPPSLLRSRARYMALSFFLSFSPSSFLSPSYISGTNVPFYNDVSILLSLFNPPSSSIPT